MFYINILIFNKFYKLRDMVLEIFDNTHLVLTDPRNIVMTKVSMYWNFITSPLAVGVCSCSL